MGIAVRPKSPIKEPADLKGKKVGSTLTSGEYPFLPAFLKNVGLTMADIQSISLDSKVRESALIDKQCDAITCFVASALPKIMAAGINPRVFSRGSLHEFCAKSHGSDSQSTGLHEPIWADGF